MIENINSIEDAMAEIARAVLPRVDRILHNMDVRESLYVRVNNIFWSLRHKFPIQDYSSNTVSYKVVSLVMHAGPRLADSLECQDRFKKDVERLLNKEISNPKEPTGQFSKLAIAGNMAQSKHIVGCLKSMKFTIISMNEWKIRWKSSAGEYRLKFNSKRGSAMVQLPNGQNFLVATLSQLSDAVQFPLE